jgi:hypothetical protein
MMHSTFRYSMMMPDEAPGPLFTLDNRRFFDTRRDVNRYARRLRVEISRCIHYLNLRRLTLLKQAMDKWHDLVKQVFLESSLQSHHVLPFNDSGYVPGHGFDEFSGTWKEEQSAAESMQKFRAELDKLHQTFRNAQAGLIPSSGVLGMGAPDTHEHILALPLGLPQYNSLDSHPFAAGMTDNYKDGTQPLQIDLSFQK